MDQSYNNLGGFGSSGIAIPASSGAGDIVLTPEKKPHKGIIIALVVAVLVIGGLFATMFIMNKNGGNANVNKDVKLAFNKYANYLLYGEDSDKVLEKEYDETEIYKLYELENASESEKKSFFENAEKLLTSFENSLSDSMKNDYGDELLDYEGDFELTKLIYVMPELDSEGFVSEYISVDDEEKLNEWINNKLAVYRRSSYEKVKKYGEDGLKYYELYKRYMDEAKVTGCLDNGTMCMDFANEELETEMQEIWLTMSETQSEALENTIVGCFNLSKVIDGVNNAQKGSER